MPWHQSVLAPSESWREFCYSYNTSLVVPTDSYNTSLFLPHRKLFQLENS